MDAELTKPDIRELSRQVDLPTADMPASPCLASRVVYGLQVTEQRLKQVEEAEDFLTEFKISASATDRVIQRSFELLGFISFFTFVKKEVKAWNVKQGTVAVDAADVIHSDMKRGFIRAEVIAYNDLIEAGSYQEARKKGTVRLEGKNYTVQDGDIITFRFNV